MITGGTPGAANWAETPRSAQTPARTPAVGGWAETPKADRTPAGPGPGSARAGRWDQTPSTERGGELAEGASTFLSFHVSCACVRVCGVCLCVSLNFGSLGFQEVSAVGQFNDQLSLLSKIRVESLSPLPGETHVTSDQYLNTVLFSSSACKLFILVVCKL